MEQNGGVEHASKFKLVSELGYLTPRSVSTLTSHSDKVLY